MYKLLQMILYKPERYIIIHYSCTSNHYFILIKPLLSNLIEINGNKTQVVRLFPLPLKAKSIVCMSLVSVT